MNKFEKLIEYIINDEDQKARELFHSIVVEKSRDIYESIVQDEMEEAHVHGDMSEINDQIASEETMGEDEDFSLTGDDDADGGPDGSLPADGDFGPADDEAGEHADLEDKVMSIDAKVDELLAKFDDIIGGGDDFSSDDKGGQFGGDQAMDQPEEQPEEDPIAEASGSGNPFAKGSGKSGMSGKSGTSGTSGSGKMESRKMSTTELMREYVDKIGDIYGGQGDANEGDAVGAGGKKTGVHTKSIEGPGANFGGEVVKNKGEEASPDGKPVPKPNNEYTKGQGTIKSGNVNVPGGKAGAPKSTGDSYEKGGDNQGDARGAMAGTGAKSEKQGEKNTKSPLVQNAGKK
jgi:hypothetical protein